MKTNPNVKHELQWIEKISNLMDARFTIPGTKFRFGMDPILGLVPGIGDITSFAISAMLVYNMAKYGASRKVVTIMMLNIIADTTLGSIPVIGNIFDFFYKANSRNIKLLKAHYEEGRYQGSGTGILIAVVAVSLLLLGLMLYGTYKFIQLIIYWLS